MYSRLVPKQDKAFNEYRRNKSTIANLIDAKAPGKSQQKNEEIRKNVCQR